MTPIEEKFDLLSQNGLDLGVAIGSEEPLFDGGSRQEFEFGTIYYHPTVGAFECHGLILKKYRDLNEVQSGLGYPISDEQDDPFVLLGRMNEFEFGSITFSNGFGANTQFNEPIDIPQVIVKLDDSIPISLQPGELFTLDDLLADIGERGGEFVIETIRFIFPDLMFRRTFESMTSQEILELIGRAQDLDPDYLSPNFDNFLEIDCPADFDTDSLANTLKAWTGVVEDAYTAPIASDPMVVGTSNPRFREQGYLQPGPKGISVQAAWTKGADGSSMNLIDIEKGWLPDHEDLPPGIQLLDGRMSSASIGHGTAVLGEIVAKDDNRGVVGIAPRAQAHLLSTRSFFVTPSSAQRAKRDRTADMIMKAISLLFQGDVILLEVQFEDLADSDRLLPVETDRRVFAAIELATRLGLIVIEPAANGKFNLDTFVNNEGKTVLLRGSADFRNSGAIMVAACQSATPNPAAGHLRESDSNFGSRIDCYAWGENITTTGTKLFPVNKDSYMNNMDGTSGAAAIIAGVCLLIQNLQTLMTPVSGIVGPLRADRIQLMMRNAANGTVSPDPIGVMPDLAKIIANEYH